MQRERQRADSCRGYKANFGKEHHFRVSQAEYSSRRFQYSGYSFRDSLTSGPATGYTPKTCL